MSTLVYRYGCPFPVENDALVREQMRLAHRYGNVLTEIERGRRAAQRDALSAYPSIRDLEVAAAQARAAVDAQLDTIRAMQSAARGFVGAEGPAERAQLAVLKAARREASVALSSARKTLRDDATYQAERMRIDDMAAGLRRNARAYCGVYWGTYQLVEAADDASRRDLPLYAIDGGPNDPQFSRSCGEGQVSVQLIQGIDAAAMFGSGTQVRVSPVDEGAWGSPKRAERRRLSRTTLSLRVGSDDARGPVWALFAMVMHRPLPAGSRVKRVTVSLRLRGPREEWSCEMTLDLAGERPRCAGTGGAVAIDIGWRLTPDGIRIATWAGENGERGEFCVSNAVVTGLVKMVEPLQGIRSKAFNLIRADVLMPWLAGNDVPEWLRYATRSLAQWHSIERLAKLVHRWGRQRFDGDESVFRACEAWRYHDRHLWRWQEDMRIKTLRRRREEMRLFSASLAARYSTLVFERFDLRTVARSAPVEAPGENPHARWQRHAMAPSELRLVLCNSFRRGMGTLARPWPDDVDATNTTRQCSACGHVASFHAADSVERDVPCPGCGAVWDQDVNAASNILARWCERAGGAPDSGTARTPGSYAETQVKEGSKWSRAKVKRAEREAKIGAARKPGGNSTE